MMKSHAAREDDVSGVPIVGAAPALQRASTAASSSQLTRSAVSARHAIASACSTSSPPPGWRARRSCHPSATIEPTANLAGWNPSARGRLRREPRIVGFGTIVNTNAVVSHDCVVSKFTRVAPGALLAGGVDVGDGVLIGMGVAVNIGVHIGAGARIGNGAVVNKDVPAGTGVVHGGQVWRG